MSGPDRSGLHLSRARLKREPALDALARQLLPDPPGERAYASHRLVWSLFAGDPAARRPFLFRERAAGDLREGRTEFLILSDRPPNPGNPLLDVETQPFAPAFAAGDRLAFSLRANATVAAKRPDGPSLRSDVVMHALHAIAPHERHLHREAVLQREGCRWLAAQGARSGFRLAGWGDEAEADGEPPPRIDGYQVWRFPKLGQRGGIAVFDSEGVLEVTNPDAFLSALARGFGRARGFGCGLMLIRRV